MSTLLNDKTKLRHTIYEREYKEQSLSEKFNTLAHVVDFLDKYQLSDLRHECALLRYYIAENSSVSLSKNCDLILDIAESFVNHGYAVLALRTVKCVFELNSSLDDYISAKAYYNNGYAYNSLDNSPSALKELKKAENIIKNSNHSLLLSQIYYQMGIAYRSHPLKRQKKKAVEYYKRSIEIKENKLGKPFSIIDDYFGYFRCIENELDSNRLLTEYIDYTISNSYTKHFRLIWLYKAKSRRKEGEDADRYLALSNECLLYRCSINKNITSLTHACKYIGIDCFIMKKYESAIMFFEVAEKLYQYWNEQDHGDLYSLYELFWNCYSKTGNKQKTKEFFKLAKKQRTIKKYLYTHSQFHNITKDSLKEYLKTLFVSEVHKSGFGLEELDEYVSGLFQRIFETIDIMEKSQYKTRTFDECCAEMLFVVGKVFRNGEYNVEPEYEYSNYLFSKAAELGSIPAKFTLIKEASETAPSIDEMVNLLIPAFEAGDCEAGRFLGMITNNMEERARYYTVVAENGNSAIKYSLGLMYRDGIGVEKNIPKAVRLWEEASVQNNPDALTEMGLVYNSDNELFELGCEPYDFRFIEKDKKKVLNFFMKASKLGDARAQFLLGQFYMQDDDMKDLSSAEFWLSKSAEQNYAMAMLFLAQLYSSKTDTAYFNYEDAVYWFDKTYFTFVSSPEEFEREIAEGARNQKENFVKHNFWYQSNKQPRWE